MLGNTGGKGAGGGSDGTNEKSTVDPLRSTLPAKPESTYTAAKMIVGLPVNLSELGQVSIHQAASIAKASPAKPSCRACCMMHRAVSLPGCCMIFSLRTAKSPTIPPALAVAAAGPAAAGDIRQRSGGGSSGDFGGGGGGGGFESFNTAGANFSSMASHSARFRLEPGAHGFARQYHAAGDAFGRRCGQRRTSTCNPRFSLSGDSKIV